MKLDTSHLSPSAEMLQMIQGHQLTQAIYVITTLGIADLLSAGPKSSNELARVTKTNASALYRVLRLLAAAGVLDETELRTFTLTPLSIYLQRDVPGSLYTTILSEGGEAMWPLLGHLLYSVQTGKPALQKTFGVDARQHFTKLLWNAPLFNKHLANQAMQLALTVASAYDFSRINTLVDVGGRHGQMLVTILKANPTLRGVLLDLSQAIEDAHQFVKNTEVVDRCELVVGDFFVSVPSECDCYLLSRVIHDWNDERAMTILRNCQQGMREDGRLLIVERVILSEKQPNLRILMSDIQMLLISGDGQERTEAEYRMLLEASGFDLTQIIPIEPPYCLIEAVRRS